MEEINEIVKSIVRGCGQAGLEVSPILAAFIARTVSYSVVKGLFFSVLSRVYL